MYPVCVDFAHHFILCVCVCVCVCICVYRERERNLRICAHMQTHTHTHTQTCVLNFPEILYDLFFTFSASQLYHNSDRLYNEQHHIVGLLWYWLKSDVILLGSPWTNS